MGSNTVAHCGAVFPAGRHQLFKGLRILESRLAGGDPLPLPGPSHRWPAVFLPAYLLPARLLALHARYCETQPIVLGALPEIIFCATLNQGPRWE